MVTNISFIFLRILQDASSKECREFRSATRDASESTSWTSRFLPASWRRAAMAIIRRFIVLATYYIRLIIMLTKTTLSCWSACRTIAPNEQSFRMRLVGRLGRRWFIPISFARRAGKGRNSLKWKSFRSASLFLWTTGTFLHHCWTVSLRARRFFNHVGNVPVVSQKQREASFSWRLNASVEYDSISCGTYISYEVHTKLFHSFSKEATKGGDTEENEWKIPLRSNTL